MNKRNFGFERKDKIDPKIKGLFPWALFLSVAAVLMVLAMMTQARGADIDIPFDQCTPSGQAWNNPGCEPPKKPSWSEYTCENVRAYLANHTEAEARAKAAELHLPQWVIRKAEKCLP